MVTSSLRQHGVEARALAGCDWTVRAGRGRKPGRGERRGKAMREPAGTWTKCTGPLYLLIALYLLLLAWCWTVSWPLAVAGHEGAVENLLTSFGVTAFALSMLAARRQRFKILCVGASLWSILFYVASLTMDQMIHGHNVGTAIRVGAVSALSFVLSAAYLIRRSA